VSEVIGEVSIVIGADGTRFEGQLRTVADRASRTLSQRLGTAFRDVGRGMERVGSSMTKWITAPAVGAATAIGGIVTAFGWGRLTSIDSAQAQLRGLGYTAEDVERISDGLVDALEGGMLTMAEATFAAAGAMAAGVEEGAELTRYVQLLDAAVAGGTGTFDEMNQVFARVTDQGYLTRELFDTISTRMPGFSSAIQNHMGVSSEAMYQMLRDGEISTADFLDIIEGFAGGMATEYAQTFDGMVANTKAYVGILGQTLLGGVFERSKESLAEFVEFLSSDEVAEWATEVGERIGQAFESMLVWLQDAITWWRELSPTVQRFLVILGGVAVAAGPVLMVAGRMAQAFGAIISILPTLAKLFGPLVTVVRLLATGFRVLFAVIMANPIVAIITVIVGALVWFFTQTETGQRIVQAVWAAIQAAIAAVADWITGTLVPALVGAWDAIVGAVQWLGEAISGTWNTVVRPVWDMFAGAVQWVWGIVSPIFSAIIDTFTAVGGFIFDVWYNVIKLAWDLMAAAITALWERWLRPTFEAINAGWQVVASWFSDRVDDIRVAWDVMSRALRAVWDWISRNVIDRFTAGFQAMRDFFSARVDDVRNLWESLKAPFQAVWTWINDNVFDRFRAGLETLQDWIRGAVETIGNLWRGVANLIREPINWVINTVWNDGLKAAFDNVARAINSDARLPAAPTIPQFAAGGYHSGGWAIVGEEGPELVNFSNPARIYSADESRRMLETGTVWSDSNPPHGGIGSWVGDRWNNLKEGASVVGGVIRDAAGEVVSWARGGLANLADLILSPIFNAVAGTVGQWGDIGRLGGDAITNVKDRMVDWIRGEDEKANVPPDAGGRSLRGALPYVNAAAFALADMVGGIRTMQAFNQSMHSSHRQGRAVDFVDSRSTLDRLANAIVSTRGFDNFRQMIWQRRVWTPQGGWAPQRSGYGNDPWHLWHVHAEWFDKGGRLRPGWNAVYNGTGADELLANVTPLVAALRRGDATVAVPARPDPQPAATGVGAGDGETRIAREDLDYVVDRLAEALWPAARAASHVLDWADMGRVRKRASGRRR